MSDLCDLSARALAALVRAGQVSALEVMDAHLARIAQWNPHVNAIIGMQPPEACRDLARQADARAARGEVLGPLHGLPIAFKDLQEAAGLPFTRGSPIYRDAIGRNDSVVVERLRHAGALPIGKTNVPEFGLGSHTYNPVWGTTRNPYDLTKSAGGSSGGAGAALATGMLPIADGSDLGGSLRNPANFNNVVALRPSVGVVPTAPDPFPRLGFGVNGPLGRSADDVALLLGVMAGADSRDPGCEPSDPAALGAPLVGAVGRAPRRAAWSPDLGGLPIEPAVRRVLDAQRRTLENVGCVVEEATLDLAGADEIFLAIRRWRSAAVYGPLLDAHRGQMKPELVEEVERGQRVSGSDLAATLQAHTDLLSRVARFFERFDVLVCAVNQVAPFDATLDWPKAIGGVPMDHYIAWMKSTYWITATFAPAVSVPAGFTENGLPVGLQLVGRPRGDRQLLELAHLFEQANDAGRLRPRLPR
jgi:amidase